MLVKDELKDFLTKFGVFKIGVADPAHGFALAKEGCHPRDNMRDCNSVVVFAFHVGLDYYTTLAYYQKGEVESRILHIYGDWVSSHLARFLEEMDYKAVVPHGYKNEKERIHHLSSKLAAYEAGLGVFGRPSIVITPEYGPRVRFGVVLTSARIKPDNPLRGFNPCQECETCVGLCPARAISKEKPPPLGFDRNRCMEFIYGVREKTKREVMLCGYCFNCCPIGKTSKKTFHLSKYKTLLDLNEDKREKLLKSMNV